MLYDGWFEGYRDGAGCRRCRGEENMGIVGAGGWGFPVGEEVHNRILDNCIWKWVAAGVPLEKLDVGDEYAMPVSAGKEAVAVEHVYN